MNASPLPDLMNELRRCMDGEVRSDPVSRLLYSTDASIYQVEPLGVAFPRSPDDLVAAVTVCAQFGVPVLPRGSGSSLAGQAIGPALVLDLSRYLTRILEIDPEARTATVEPGVILNNLNRAAAVHRLQFGPDPASAERATLGGSLANNASGAHSIRYGMAGDHLLSADVLLADGSLAVFEPQDLDAVARWSTTTGSPSILASIYHTAMQIRAESAEAIRQHWPRTWRRAAGYSLNYLLPWSPANPPAWDDDQAYPPLEPGKINLAHLLAGSEGTLAIIRRAKLRLVPLPEYTVLGVLPFSSIAEACEAVPGLLTQRPAAVELIPQALIRLARSVPAYARQLNFLESLELQGERAAMLVVEFAGSDLRELRSRADALGPDALVADRPDQQRQVWAVRKVGLGIFMSQPGDRKPWSFIEDLAVPVEKLGNFVRAMDQILARHGTTAEIYAHASAGCLHIRPLLNLKTVDGVRDLRSIADQAVALTLELGGSVSGEHGLGIARSEWLERMYGPEIISAFRQLKAAADPHGLLNPGKIVNLDPQQPLPRMDSGLRFGPEYRANAWEPLMDLGRLGGLAGAIEQCNGAGVCRKSEGVMCPSFQATQEEMHSTRGRANLLRAMISGRFPAGMLPENAAYQALDLCLACKGCQAECPSGVDMARLKYEFMAAYYRRHPHPLRDYLFGYIGPLVSVGHYLAPVVNLLLHLPLVQRLGEHLLGLSARRPFPRMAAHTALDRWQRKSTAATPHPAVETVLFMMDAFNCFFYPEAGLAALTALEKAGCRPIILPVTGAGRTLISKGFLDAAQMQARSVLKAINRLDPSGQVPVVGIEPSEILTLRDEYPQLLHNMPGAEQLAERAWMIDEYLLRPGPDGRARLERIESASSIRPAAGRHVLLHGHCYQKAQPPAADGGLTGQAATRAMLEAAGYNVTLAESGCCGMAGAFGYEAEHFDVSMAVGELALLPEVRQAGEQTIIAASGVSCQAQIEDGTGHRAVHPITLI